LKPLRPERSAEWPCQKAICLPLGKFGDIAMFVMTGGRERTVEEYRPLLGRAGFGLKQVILTSSDLNIIEALPD
jgi:hypothetical protein